MNHTTTLPIPVSLNLHHDIIIHNKDKKIVKGNNLIAINVAFVLFA
jgi:hypothetical protein